MEYDQACFVSCLSCAASLGFWKEHLEKETEKILGVEFTDVK